MLALELGPQAAAVVIDPEHARGQGDGRRLRLSAGRLRSRDAAPSGSRARRSSRSSTRRRSTRASSRRRRCSSTRPQVYARRGCSRGSRRTPRRRSTSAPVRLRVALAQSLNTVASQLVDVHAAASIRRGRAAGARRRHRVGARAQPVAGAGHLGGHAAGDDQRVRDVRRRRQAPATPQLHHARSAPDGPSRERRRAPAVQAIRPELAYLMTVDDDVGDRRGHGGVGQGQARPAGGGQDRHDQLDDTGRVVRRLHARSGDRRVGRLRRHARARRAASRARARRCRSGSTSWPARSRACRRGRSRSRRAWWCRRSIRSRVCSPQPGAANAMEEVFLDGTAPTQLAPTQGEANPDTYIIDQGSSALRRRRCCARSAGCAGQCSSKRSMLQLEDGDARVGALFGEPDAPLLLPESLDLGGGVVEVGARRDRA